MRAPYNLSLMLLIFMIGQSVLGLVFPDQYRDLGYVRETWFGNDLITLVLGVPLLAVSLRLERHNFVLGRLLWLGVLGYGVYNYAFYLFGAALNAFFPIYPIYIVLFLLSIVTLMFALSRTDMVEVARRFSAKTPVRSDRWLPGFRRGWVDPRLADDVGRTYFWRSVDPCNS